MKELIIKILICFCAGLGAGLGTGFAGMSAAAVIGPLLLVIGVPYYVSVGVGLASDVLASGASAILYGKKKNIDIKHGLIMMISVICFTFVGSYVAKFIKPKTMEIGAVISITLLGLKFLIFPVKTTKEQMEQVSNKKKIIGSILGGMVVGFVCGFVGAGGGMLMLLVLTTVLSYELHTAVGTSVFIMTFTALTGSVSHFLLSNEEIDWLVLGLCMVFTLIFSIIASKIANKVSSKILNRIVGIVLLATGVVTLIFRFIL